MYPWDVSSQSVPQNSERTREFGSQALWGRVLRASTAVVGLIQRPFGFWGYPTNEVEMRKFYPYPGQNILKDIARGTFYTPFGSYTVTWLALVALNEIFGSVPDQILQRVRQGFVAIEPQAGGYGRPVLLRAGPAIHPTARHTAMALLTRMHFLPDYRPDEWITSVQWMLESQIRETGGWRNREPTHLEEAAHFEANGQSTAVCLSALCTFLADRGKAGRTISGSLQHKIERALAKGFQRLTMIRSDGLWKGTQPETDIIDTAFIIEIISVGTAYTKMKEIVPDLDSHILEFKKGLLRASVGDGWPTRLGEKEPSLAATICATFALIDTIGGNDFRTMLWRAENYIIDELANKRGGQRLWSWDWLVLARLAERRSASVRISEAERFEILTKLDGIHDLVRIRRICRYLRMSAPREADDAALFLLNKGIPRNGGYLVIGVGRLVFNNWRALLAAAWGVIKFSKVILGASSRSG